ncbi:CHL4 [[Candida] subhashii]|uniref:CHL4 n=1 Tax=[Candida] subhashii TaxID=561895 RepID=A0A8J5QEP6_9ASCO|nr:CHL4 [[Candida] subhashii]KAG7660789.1 CHL4 [[Candida] subhashii]
MIELRTSTTSNSNVLPNSHIPNFKTKQFVSMLMKLTKRSLIEFIFIWLKQGNCQPHYKPTDSLTKAEFLNKVKREALQIKQTSSQYTKKQIIEKIVYDYWSNGLNLLQLSQIDCQLLLIDKPNNHEWIHSTVKDMNNHEVPISLNPGDFLDSLIKQLSQVYMTYIYICQHPKYPIITIRIQVFDLNTIRIVSSRAHLISHRPYFFCIPMSSPHVIHTPASSTVHKIVMDSIERSLPQNANNLLKLHTPRHQSPMKSIQSMLIYTGNSRFSNSLGIWSKYADNRVDMLPLDAIENHPAIKDDSDEDEPVETNLEESPELKRLKKIANIRFKGSPTGRIKSRNVYQDLRIKQHHEQHGTSPPPQVQEITYESLAPVQNVEFIVRETTKPTTTSIKLKLVGNDVFGGLHELCVWSDDKNKMILDPEEIPQWLTGEEGNASGEVIDSTFMRK